MRLITYADTKVKAKCDDAPHDGGTTRVGPVIVKPVVPNGECCSKLGKIQEMI